MTSALPSRPWWTGRSSVALASLPVLGALALAWPSVGQAQNQGLSAPAHALSSTLDALTENARWQARLERDPLPMALSSGVGTPLWLLAPDAPTLRWLGDYQSGLLRLGRTGGLRLTGGLLLTLKPAQGLLAGRDAGSGFDSGTGYAGVGYSSGSIDSLWGRWDFSADLGLAGPRFGRPGASFTGPAGNGLRDGSSQPLLRLGMSLSF